MPFGVRGVRPPSDVENYEARFLLSPMPFGVRGVRPELNDVELQFLASVGLQCLSA